MTPIDRDVLGRVVREAWVLWARTQPDPKPSWLVPYDELSEPDKEADRQIGQAVAAVAIKAKALEDGKVLADCWQATEFIYQAARIGIGALKDEETREPIKRGSA